MFDSLLFKSMEKLLEFSKLSSSIILVDDNNLRGVIAPSEFLTKEILEDLVDLILYSNSKVVDEINNDFRKAEKEGLEDGKELKRSLDL